MITNFIPNDAGWLLTPEPELRRWFSWQWYWPGTLVDDLVRADRLRRLDGHVAVG